MPEYKPVPRLTERQAARFLDMIDKRLPHECWEWTGWCNSQGYGLVSIFNSNFMAHRLAYAVEHGPLSSHSLVCHSCDNPTCCNPAHLWLGTHADNAQDSARKGRRTHLVGDTSPRHTLTEKQVKEIKHSLIQPYTGIGKTLAKRKCSAVALALPVCLSDWLGFHDG